MSVTANLPEIKLTNVEFHNETWDFGYQAGMCAEVTFGSESVLRSAIGWQTSKQIRPPRYETREVVFEVRDRPNDPDCVPRYVTQEVEVVIDYGETRPLTRDELRAKRADAKVRLLDWLAHVALAGKLLTESGAESGIVRACEAVISDSARAALPGFCRTRHIQRIASLGPGYNDPDKLLVLVEFEPGARATLLDMAQLDADLATLLGYPVDVRTAQDIDRYRRDELLSRAVDIWHALDGEPSGE